MTKPKNWKEVNRIRENFAMELIDDINKCFDDTKLAILEIIDEKRIEAVNLLVKRSRKYKDMRREQKSK
jgi:hypothetical protein